MYIIAIAWLYVALMVSIADTSVLGGIMTFLFSGLGPLALFLWLFGTPARKRARLARERHEEQQRGSAPNQSAPPGPSTAKNPGGRESHQPVRTTMRPSAKPASSCQPDSTGHAPGGLVSTVGEETPGIRKGT